MGFNFDAVKKRAEPKKREKQNNSPATQEQKEYRQRAKADTDRYKLAVDADFHSVFCFSTAEKRDEFALFSGADGEYFAFGDVLADKLKGKKIKAMGMKQPKGYASQDPFYDIPYEQLTLEEACFAEADALLEAFEQREKPKSYKCVYDSRFYVCVIFKSRDHRSHFLRASGIVAFGDNYIDGDEVLKRIL